jgi:hypothetical protein
MSKTILTKKHLNNFTFFTDTDLDGYYSKKYNLAYDFETKFIYIEAEIYDSKQGSYKDAIPVQRKLLTLEDFEIMLTALTGKNFIRNN